MDDIEGGFKEKTVLVTGGAGAIRGNIVKALNAFDTSTKSRSYNSIKSRIQTIVKDQHDFHFRNKDRNLAFQAPLILLCPPTAKE
jgi:hypothetical protein